MQSEPTSQHLNATASAPLGKRVRIFLQDGFLAGSLIAALLTVGVLDTPSDGLNPNAEVEDLRQEDKGGSGDANDDAFTPRSAVDDATTAPANGSADVGEEGENARQPRPGNPTRLAIVDTFQPFAPKIVDAQPESVELSALPDPEPPKMLAEEQPTIEVSKPAEPQKVEFFQAEAKATSVGFAVDCSSSMTGEKFQAVCNELASSILQLKPDQRFFVAFFNDQFFPMTGSAASPTLVNATRDNKEAILKFLASASASGGTEPEPAIRFLATLKPDIVYLLTDGAFAPLSAGTYELLTDAKIAVHAIGFETDGRIATLEEIAQRTNGTYRSAAIGSTTSSVLYLAPPQAVQAALSRADPKIRREAAQVAAWRDLPCLNKAIALLADVEVRDSLHEALRDLADSSDFGPSGADDVADSIRRWTNWWTLRKAVNAKKRILASLQSSDRDEVWVAASLARSTGLKEPDALITALRNAPSPIWQELHSALLRCCPEAGDLGPHHPAAPPAELEEAADRWAKWRTAEREQEARAVFETRCKRSAELLRLAKYFIDTKPGVFQRRCTAIIRDYSDTPAAAEARALLESLDTEEAAD